MNFSLPSSSCAETYFKQPLQDYILQPTWGMLRNATSPKDLAAGEAVTKCGQAAGAIWALLAAISRGSDASGTFYSSKLNLAFGAVRDCCDAAAGLGALDCYFNPCHKDTSHDDCEISEQRGVCNDWTGSAFASLFNKSKTLVKALLALDGLIAFSNISARVASSFGQNSSLTDALKGPYVGHVRSLVVGAAFLLNICHNAYNDKKSISKKGFSIAQRSAVLGVIGHSYATGNNKAWGVGEHAMAALFRTIDAVTSVWISHCKRSSGKSVSNQTRSQKTVPPNSRCDSSEDKKSTFSHPTDSGGKLYFDCPISLFRYFLWMISMPFTGGIGASNTTLKFTVMIIKSANKLNIKDVPQSKGLIAMASLFSGFKKLLTPWKSLDRMSGKKNNPYAGLAHTWKNEGLYACCMRIFAFLGALGNFFRGTAVFGYEMAVVSRKFGEGGGFNALSAVGCSSLGDFLALLGLWSLMDDAKKILESSYGESCEEKRLKELLKSLRTFAKGVVVGNAVLTPKGELKYWIATAFTLVTPGTYLLDFAAKNLRGNDIPNAAEKLD